MCHLVQKHSYRTIDIFLESSGMEMALDLEFKWGLVAVLLVSIVQSSMSRSVLSPYARVAIPGQRAR